MILKNCFIECTCGKQTPILNSEFTVIVCRGCNKEVPVASEDIKFFEEDSKQAAEELSVTNRDIL